MRAFATAVALATVPQTLAAFQGFNYASTFSTNAAKQQSDFEAEFKVAQGLVGAPGTFSSARLYTTVVSCWVCLMLSQKRKLTRIIYSKLELPTTLLRLFLLPSRPKLRCSSVSGLLPVMPASPTS